MLSNSLHAATGRTRLGLPLLRGAPRLRYACRGITVTAVERLGTGLAQLACAARCAPPEVVVIALHLVQQQVVAAAKAHFEIASALAFRAEPSAGPVGAAEIDHSPVNNDRFEVNARAHPENEASIARLARLPQSRPLAHLFDERPRRWRC